MTQEEDGLGSSVLGGGALFLEGVTSIVFDENKCFKVYLEKHCNFTFSPEATTVPVMLEREGFS